MHTGEHVPARWSARNLMSGLARPDLSRRAEIGISWVREGILGGQGTLGSGMQECWPDTMASIACQTNLFGY